MALSLDALPYETFYRLGLHKLTWHRDEPMPEIIRFFDTGQLAGTSVLEVGAGAASNALWLARQGYSACAIDFAPRAVEIARARAERERVPLRTRIIDVTRGEPSLGRFDVVIDRECLQDLQDPAQRMAYARNVLGWMAPGAALVIATWVYRNEAQHSRRFPTARLALDEVPRLFPTLHVETRELEHRKLFGLGSAHATFLLRQGGI
jgi:2-polyprenyl-3-methyl-5-hydroxy-6-metoxy-1,4-benzoquinol methylase